ncbi:MAG: hypothetical protein RL386_1543, partial [Bacteroidota bacterium]
MTNAENLFQYDRRSFLKVSALAGGGLLVGVQWLYGRPNAQLPNDEAARFNAYIKIYPDGRIVIMSPNPEIGQGVKTSMPMIVAEELDADWNMVTVEQAPLDTVLYTRQVAGGSGSIRASWTTLRKAGATARTLLITAAAQQWQVNPEECTAADSVVRHPASGRTLGYGQLATAAAAIPPPGAVSVKLPADFRLLGKFIPNVDNHAIVTGEKLYGSDLKREGMLVAVVARPPAFGLKLLDLDDRAAKSVPGVQQVIRFGNKVAVLANTTWEAKKGRDALVLQWMPEGALEDSAQHDKALHELLERAPERPFRNDGDAGAAFAKAARIVEASYACPFLPHNAM